MRILGSLVLAGVVAACGGGDHGSAASAADDRDAGASTRGGGVPGASSGAAPSGPTWSSAPTSGKASWYVASGAGACSFDPSPSDLDVVALDDRTYGEGSWCGACLEVVGPKGTVTVRAVDRCPECESGHLDLSKQAFAKIANSTDDGEVEVSYEFVACEAPGNVAYRYKEGSSRYWTAIQVLHHKLPIQKLEYQDGTQWKAIPRLYYNYFVEEGGVGPQPGGLTLRLTAVDGQILTDTLPAFADEPLGTNVHDGHAQFE